MRRHPEFDSFLVNSRVYELNSNTVWKDRQSEYSKRREFYVWSVLSEKTLQTTLGRKLGKIVSYIVFPSMISDCYQWEWFLLFEGLMRLLDNSPIIQWLDRWFYDRFVIVELIMKTNQIRDLDIIDLSLSWFDCLDQRPRQDTGTRPEIRGGRREGHKDWVAHTYYYNRDE